MDEFAEFGEPFFVGGIHAALLLEGFEDGKSAGEIIESFVRDGEVTL